MENIAAHPNTMVAMAQFEGHIIGKYVYHVKEKLEQKSNKTEHLKKIVAVNEIKKKTNCYIKRCMNTKIQFKR